MPTLEAARRAVAAVTEVRDPAGSEAVDGVPPGLVARPGDTAQVAEVMRAAAAHGLTVVPRGAGTKLGWGHPPRSVDVLLDLSAMAQVLDHQAGDLIAEAEAGTPLHSLQEQCGREGQRLVVDEMVPGTTVGGMLATNTSGPQRMLVGTARDLLIGVTMVRADGVVAKAGGRVVKNVAGYDLGKLLIGSFGTLGVITEAIFRLHPVPEASRWVSAPVADPADADQLARTVVHSQVVPHAVEVDVDADGVGSVSVLVAGRETAVEQRAAAVASMLGGRATQSDEPPGGWATHPWHEGEVALKLTCVLSGVRQVLATAEKVRARVRGSAGTGVLHAALPGGSPEEVGPAVDRLRAACVAQGGSAVVLDGPAGLKASLDLWGEVPALDLMRRVKDQFDPEHRLAPGRFVGGI